MWRRGSRLFKGPLLAPSEVVESGVEVDSSTPLRLKSAQFSLRRLAEAYCVTTAAVGVPSAAARLGLCAGLLPSRP